MNPLKCAFGVTSSKFLGFVVQHQGIETDQAKVKAIQDMPKPKNVKELCNLQECLAYFRRYLSPFRHLMKKAAPFEWDESCKNIFKSIKKYLSSPPVLGCPILGKPLILYIATKKRSLGVMYSRKC